VGGRAQPQAPWRRRAAGSLSPYQARTLRGKVRGIPRIVNVASVAGSHDDKQYGLTARQGAVASYAISKAAVFALTATLAAELDGTSVIVNAVDPDLTATWPGAETMGARLGWGGCLCRHGSGISAGVCRRRSAGDLELVADPDSPESHPGGADHRVVFGPGADMAG